MPQPVSQFLPLKPDVFEKSLAINVTSNYRLIRSMDALLRQSPAPRAVFITSGITGLTLPGMIDEPG